MPEALKSTIHLIDWTQCAMIKTKHHGLLKNAPALLNRIEHRLSRNGVGQAAAIELNSGKIKGSAVLFLLTSFRADREIGFEPCLLLNKRSQHILQPGDLCCPGGGVERRDQWLSPNFAVAFFAHLANGRSGKR